MGRFQDMYDSNPLPVYSFLFRELEKRGIAYLHLMEPKEFFAAPSLYEPGENQIAEACKTFRSVFKGTIIMNNNLTPESAAQAIKEGYADLASFGRYFIGNPDFVERVQNGWPLNDWDVSTFYVGGVKGYLDYPLYDKNATATPQQQTPQQTSGN